MQPCHLNSLNTDISPDKNGYTVTMSTEATAESIAETVEIGDEPTDESDCPVRSDKLGEANATKNFVVLILYQIAMRTGWIFKTESIIMPAVLDTIGGPGWLRGCLPMLNRFGQSIPPVLASGRIHSAGHKKWVLAGCSTVMGLIFWVLAAIWLMTDGLPTWWMAGVFLLLYGIFFVSTGINQLTMNTLVGKLIPVERRGRLMLYASTIGTATAVLCAAVLLPKWLSQDPVNFFAIFAITGTLFFVGAAVIALLNEKQDDFPKSKQTATSLFRSAGQALAEDVHLRRIAIVGALFGMSLTLFPHYQALGRVRLGFGLDSLMPWVITQNLGVALFSVPAGWLTDRYGNRIVLRLLMPLMIIAPLVGLGMSTIHGLSSWSYSVVFLLIGATPVTIRTLTLYCLELTSREHQPRYLSTLSLCTAGPAILTAPFLGGLVDALGFEPVFYFVVGCLAAAWLMTWRIVEPRTAVEA